jgi:predicted transcriptional regulator
MSNTIRPNEAKKLKELLRHGAQKSIAEKLNLSKQAVSKALNEERPNHPAVIEATRMVQESGSLDAARIIDELFEALRREVAETRAEVKFLKAQLPDWMREHEAQRYTGLSQSTISRERRKPDTLIVWKSEGGVRYLRSSLDAFNEARQNRKNRYAQAA